MLSADHLYQLDLRPLLAQHAERGSDLTIITTEVLEDPSRYGVVTARGGEVRAYDYKPDDPKGQVVATEVFVFDVAALRRACEALLPAGSDGTELGDYGETLIPYLVDNGTVHEFRMDGYWRDLGTIDAYFRAHMELIEGTGIDLHRRDWPLLSNLSESAPARIAPDAEIDGSLVCPGAFVAGRVEHSLIGPGVRVEKGATVRRCVLLGDVTVPAGAHLESVIADHGAEIPAGRTGQTKPGPGNITVLVPDATTDEGDALTP